MRVCFVENAKIALAGVRHKGCEGALVLFERENPRISANHCESRSDSLALAYSGEYARGIRQRSAERLTRASGARKIK